MSMEHVGGQNGQQITYQVVAVPCVWELADSRAHLAIKPTAGECNKLLQVANGEEQGQGFTFRCPSLQLLCDVMVSAAAAGLG